MQPSTLGYSRLKDNDAFRTCFWPASILFHHFNRNLSLASLDLTQKPIPWMTIVPGWRNHSHCIRKQIFKLDPLSRVRCRQHRSAVASQTIKKIQIKEILQIHALKTSKQNLIRDKEKNDKYRKHRLSSHYR